MWISYLKCFPTCCLEILFGRLTENSVGSRPSDKGGRGEGGHPDPKIRGWAGLKIFFFRPFGPQFGPKISLENAWQEAKYRTKKMFKAGPNSSKGG